jgi:hypothetical protein
MHVYTYACMYVRMHVCMYVRMHVGMYVVCTQVCLLTYITILTCILLLI